MYNMDLDPPHPLANTHIQTLRPPGTTVTITHTNTNAYYYHWIHTIHNHSLSFPVPSGNPQSPTTKHTVGGIHICRCNYRGHRAQGRYQTPQNPTAQTLTVEFPLILRSRSNPQEAFENTTRTKTMNHHHSNQSMSIKPPQTPTKTHCHVLSA